MVPPPLQVRRIRQFADLLTWDTDQMLLGKPVEVFPFLQMLFVLQRRLGLDRRIRQTLEIAQLEPPRAVHVILQGGLGEGGEIHSVASFQCTAISVGVIIVSTAHYSLLTIH